MILGLRGLLRAVQTTVDFMVVVAVLGGLAGDVWLVLLRDHPSIFAFALPATLYAIYLGALQLVYGTWWEIHVLTGMVVVAGITGWLVAFLARRPQHATV